VRLIKGKKPKIQQELAVMNNILCVVETPFAAPQDSLLKTLVMMSGEYNYEDIFLNSGPVPFQFTTYAG
jgi:hypothetical protein